MADSRYPYPRLISVPLSLASSKFGQTSLTFFSFLWINFARSSCVSVGLFLKGSWQIYYTIYTADGGLAIG